MKFILMFFLIFGMYCAEAQTKRALVIGIGSYPAQSGWSKIHGDNDVPIIANALALKGFNANNIQCLTNENATKSNIIKGLNQIIKLSEINDFIYIHFSTHGQQVIDISGDEEDGLDEAIIPVDACKKFIKGQYEGKNHLIDDELNRYLVSIRQKIGKSGILLVCIDACHSGDATRGNDTGNDTLMVRGTSDIFQAGKQKSYVPKQLKPLEWVVVSATQSHQNNYEYLLNGTYFGSLSYAIKLSLTDLSGQYNFLELFTSIKKKQIEMNVAGYPQKPMLEGDVYYQKQKAF